MSTPFRLAGSQGVSLAGACHGPQGGRPIVFLHGFAQSHRAFRRTLSDPLSARFRLVAFDLRGHGASDRPTTLEAYTESARWAEDLDAVLRQHAPSRPVLVAWSYGGVVVGDYLRHFGPDRLAGVVFVAATPAVGRPARPWLGPALLAASRAMLSDAVEESEPAARSFLQEATAATLPPDDFAPLVETALSTPLHVRRALFARSESYDAELASLSCPVLAVHGALDHVISPAASAHVARTAPNARALIYEDTGHMPFLESAARFERDLASFVDAM